MAKKVIRLTESEFKELIQKVIKENEDMNVDMGDRFSLEDEYRGDPHKALRKALKKTMGMRAEERLEKISDMVGGYGVESIQGRDVDNYWMDTVALYVNMGDTYNTTILYNTDLGKYTITTWGDWVERNQRRYDIR